MSKKVLVHPEDHQWLSLEKIKQGRKTLAEVVHHLILHYTRPEPITPIFPNEIMEKIAQMAEEEGLSQTGLVNSWLVQALEKDKKEDQAMREELAAFAGGDNDPEKLTKEDYHHMVESVEEMERQQGPVGPKKPFTEVTNDDALSNSDGS